MLNDLTDSELSLVAILYKGPDKGNAMKIEWRSYSLSNMENSSLSFFAKVTGLAGLSNFMLYSLGAELSDFVLALGHFLLNIFGIGFS